MKTKKQDNNKCLTALSGDVNTLMRVVFGDEETNEIGMKAKVDEIHETLIKFQGWKAFLGIVILIGGAIAALKGITTFFK